MYKFLRNAPTPDPSCPSIVMPACLVNTVTGSIFLLDPNNKDYQEYQTWVEKGNIAEPADDVMPDYRAQRAAEYPSIGDQLDALFHAGLMPLEIAIQIQAVKTKYPKV